MDNKATLNKLKKEVKKFCEDRDWDQFHNPKDLAIGISTEANELLDIFRFQTQAQIIDIMENASTRENVEDELADTFFFVLRFAQINGIDLESALHSKITKNAKRYSVNIAKGNNQKIVESTDKA